MFKLIYKDLGISSNKAINIFKKENNINKIGHTGTLDVLAQGLLLLATDDDTKLIPYISNKEKEYKVIAKLGFISKTYDSEGPITFFSKKIPSEKEVFQVVNSFIGKIKQKPPIYSSKKINGKKAYELARKNKEVRLKEISIEIFDIFDIKYKYPFIEFKSHVSNGTYIRTLVDDIGKKLETGAYVTFLERIMISGLRLNDQVNIDNLIKLKKIFINDKKELIDFFNGKIKKLNKEDDTYLLEFNGNCIGVIEINNGIIIKNNLFGNKIKKILEERTF